MGRSPYYLEPIFNFLKFWLLFEFNTFQCSLKAQGVLAQQSKPQGHMAIPILINHAYFTHSTLDQLFRRSRKPLKVKENLEAEAELQLQVEAVKAKLLLEKEKELPTKQRRYFGLAALLLKRLAYYFLCCSVSLHLN